MGNMPIPIPIAEKMRPPTSHITHIQGAAVWINVPTIKIRVERKRQENGAGETIHFESGTSTSDVITKDKTF
jgi:hypothetical protein